MIKFISRLDPVEFQIFHLQAQMAALSFLSFFPQNGNFEIAGNSAYLYENSGI